MVAASRRLARARGDRPRLPGRRFGAESDLSTYVAGFSDIEPGGFSFPFGDYFEMAIDDRGDTHLIWGEGLDWQSPGSIRYARGR